MGLSSKKTKNEPWAPAQPYILKGMEQTNQVFDANQPMLQEMSNEAYDAFKGLSPEAFQASPFVKNAQASASAIGTGGLLGANPGQATYNRMQNPGAGGPMGGGNATRRIGGNDPSMGLLGRMATDQTAGGGDAALGGLMKPGANPADRMASSVAGGKYLNNQPSAGLYGAMMSPEAMNGNPWLQSVIDSTNAGVAKNANRMFASRGMGAGLSTAFGDVLSKNLAANEGNLRYQNFNDASGRALQAAGQSDSAFGAERGRMDASNGLLSQNFNAGQDRSLAAAQALNASGQAQRQQQLAAAQALGGRVDAGNAQFNAGEDRSLDAARASDAAQQSQVQQMLTALGLTGDLRNAEFAGVNPALSLLNTAADIPYVGTAALNGQIRQASNGYGTTTTSGGLGGQLLGAGAQMGSAYLRGR
jgi:hypothetical protein